MKRMKNLKGIIWVTLAVAVVTFAGCSLFKGDDDGDEYSTAGPSPVLPNPGPASSSGTVNTPTPPTTTPAELVQPKVYWLKDPLGAHWSCSDQVYSKDDVIETLVRLENPSTGIRVKVDGLVFQSDEPGCADTGEPGPRGVLEITPPENLAPGEEWLQPGESGNYLVRIIFANLQRFCGRLQVGFGVTFSEPQDWLGGKRFWQDQARDRVLNTGSTDCEPPPPPPECPANAFFDIVLGSYTPVGSFNGECPEYYGPKSYTVNTNLPKHDVTEPPEWVEGKGFPVKEETYYGTFSGVGKLNNGEVCARDSETVEVPGCKECKSCVDAHLTVVPSHKKVDGDSYDVTFAISSSHPGELKVNGDVHAFGAGSSEITVGPFRCGTKLSWSAHNQDGSCGEVEVCKTRQGTYELPGCQCEPCIDARLEVEHSHEKVEGGYKVTFTVESSLPGELTVNGNTVTFGAGISEHTFGPFECETDITWSAYNEDNKCGEPEKCETKEGCFRLPECDPCEDSMLDYDVSTDECEACIQIESTHGGLLRVFKDGQKVHEESFEAGGDEICMDDLEAGRYTFSLTTNCDEKKDEFTVECTEECVVDIPRACLYFQPPLGSPESECGYFGLVPIGKDDGLSSSTHYASMDAALAIVKAGNFYNIYPNVSKGDKLESCDQVTQLTLGAGMMCKKDISHVTYCWCDEK